jgi:hypothetical protein
VGIDREIIPHSSMSTKNSKADGGQWNLVNKENENLFWEKKVHFREM